MTFLLPGIYWILKLYGANFATHRCSQASSLGFVRIYVSGLLSVQTVKEYPFSQWLNLSQKAHLRARNSRRWAGYLACARVRDLLAKAIGRALLPPSGT